jgi:ribosomal protein S5
MKKTQSSKLNSLLALKMLFAANPELIAGLVALEEAAQELTDKIMAININVKVQSTPSGAARAKKDALTAVGDLAYEVAGGVQSFAEKSGDAVLAARVSFSRSAVTAGGANGVVARIQGIIDAATENLASLGDHGVTQAKVNSLKQRLKTYDALRTMPRHAKGASAAATRQLAKLFPQTDRLLKKRIDKLVWQFRDSEPEFYHKYQVARSIVGAPTSAKDGSSADSDQVPGAKAA